MRWIPVYDRKYYISEIVLTRVVQSIFTYISFSHKLFTHPFVILCHFSEITCYNRSICQHTVLMFVLVV